MFKSFYPIIRFSEFIIYNVSIPLLIFLGILTFLSKYLSGMTMIVYLLCVFIVWVFIAFIVLYFRDKYFISKISCKNYDRIKFDFAIKEITKNRRIKSKISLKKINERFVKNTLGSFDYYHKTIIIGKINKTFLITSSVNLIFVINPESLTDIILLKKMDNLAYIYIINIQGDKQRLSFKDIDDLVSENTNIQFLDVDNDLRFNSHFPIYIHDSIHSGLINTLETNYTKDQKIYDLALSKIVRREFLHICEMNTIMMWHHKYSLN